MSASYTACVFLLGRSSLAVRKAGQKGQRIKSVLDGLAFSP